MKRVIKKVAVLGSGVMGSRIACHFSGVGLQVLLLDIEAPSNSPEGGELGRCVTLCPLCLRVKKNTQNQDL